jgi:type I restriction enzyme S subunit
VAYYFQTKTAFDYYKDKQTGSTIKNLSLKAIRECFIPLPPIAEQHRIVTAIELAFGQLKQITGSLK